MCDATCACRNSSDAVRVRWADLLPDQFRARRAACPIAWLPLGLCEPHGHAAAYGLDTIKADWLCDEGARRYGGIVAPTQAWHIHETGYHARWLEETVGEEEAELGTLPPDVLLRTFLYQLRALANAGFKSAIVVSGHAGGNQYDLRRVAAAFAGHVHFRTEIFADPELVTGKYDGDHAGKFELSQLLAIRPDLVDLSLLKRGNEPGAGGRLAIGDDASLATSALGRAILDAQLAKLGEVVQQRLAIQTTVQPSRRVSLAETEELWAGILRNPEPFVTTRPAATQSAVSSKSRWKSGEYFSMS